MGRHLSDMLDAADRLRTERKENQEETNDLTELGEDIERNITDSPKPPQDAGDEGAEETVNPDGSVKEPDLEVDAIPVESMGQVVTLYHNDLHMLLYALQFVMSMLVEPERAFEAFQQYQVAVAAGDEQDLNDLVKRLLDAHKAEVAADPTWHDRAAERLADHMAKASLVSVLAAADGPKNSKLN